MKLIPDRLLPVFSKRIDASGLALFRIVYSTILAAEVFQYFRFRHLVFDVIPFLEPYELNMFYPLLLWLASLICLIAGFRTKTAAVANYVLTVTLLSSLYTFNYHVHLAYLGLNILLMILPVSRVWSVDSWLETRRSPNEVRDRSVNVFAYYLPIYVGLGLVYFDSIFYKFSSDMWLKGLGVWKPSTLVFVAFHDTSFLLNREFFIKALSYITLVFELIFLFTFWFRRFRTPLLIIGLGLHVGILIAFPIPWFALTACAIYILLAPVSWWRKLFGFKKAEASADPSGLAGGNPNLWSRPVILYYGMIFLLVWQMVLVLNYDPMNLREKTGIKGTFIDNLAVTATAPLIDFGRRFLGLAGHPVFIDRIHFNNYNHVIKVKYLDKKNNREVLLPITTEDGMPGKYMRGGVWVKWCFRVISKNVKMEQLNDGLRRYTAFWAVKNNIPLDNAEFRIYVKKVEIPGEWEKDVLKKQRAAPWQLAGSVYFIDEHFSSSLPEIESL